MRELRTAIARFLSRMRESPTRWIGYGLIVGVGAGLGAVIFFVVLEVASQLTLGWLSGMPPPVPPGDALVHVEALEPGPVRRWVFFLLPALGGLLSGLLVYRYAPEAEGHGTDEMIRAFHHARGMIRTRVPLIKGLATVLTLAGGGSAGKEGPIAQIGGGIGSLLATRLGLSSRDRRILLLAGAGAGLGAIFRAPLGSAITAIEVLYHEDFESDALIPSVIASFTAYSIFVAILGGARIFSVPQLAMPAPREVPGYLLLALITVPVGWAYIRIFYGTRDRIFRKLPLPLSLRPMVGGLGVGLIGLFYPQAYGAGWGYIQQALDGEIVIHAMAWVLLAKILATSFTIGSGGSGGVFGPTLFIGGFLGGVIGYTGNQLAPGLFPHPGAYVLVGMASFFASVASAPVGAMLMVTEMTGGYALLPPLMLVSVLSILLMRRQSIYENQVQDRFHSPAHIGDLTINVLEEMKVGDVFHESSRIPCVSPGTAFPALRRLLLEAREATVPVVDAEGRLAGLVTAEQLRPVLDEHQLAGVVVASDICAPPLYVHRDDDLYRAHELFRASGCPQIPVMDETPEGGPPRLVGMIDYRELMRAYGRELARRREGA